MESLVIAFRENGVEEGSRVGSRRQDARAASTHLECYLKAWTLIGEFGIDPAHESTVSKATRRSVCDQDSP